MTCEICHDSGTHIRETIFGAHGVYRREVVCGYCDIGKARGGRISEQTEVVVAPDRIHLHPLDGAVDLQLDGVALVSVSGGEQPLHPDWVRSVRDQCRDAGVLFRFASWGDWAPIESIEANGSDWTGMHEPPSDGGAERHHWLDSPMRDTARRRGFKVAAYAIAGDTVVLRVGRDRSGRFLDGVHGGVD